jgi:hypothetical protein
MLLFVMAAMAAPVQIPVQGAISAPEAVGTVSTRFLLTRDADATDVVHDETQLVAFADGAFSVTLGTAASLESEDLATDGPLFMTLRVGTGASSAAVPVGWSARAAWAAHAGDAASLGGEPPSTYQRASEAWQPGAGVVTTGRTFSVTGDNFATSNQGCTPGQVVTGISSTGAVTCAVDANSTYSGSNFATSNQGCSAGQVVTGVSPTGAVTCAAVAQANLACATGSVVTGFTAAGAPICAVDKDTTYSGANFALSNRSCTTGSVISGIDSNGLPVCSAAGGSTPIGSIIAWHKSLANTPALPAGWLECNGQTVSDAASPYNGQAVPNLTGGRFLRGGTTSGALGGSTSHTHSFSQTSADLAPDASNVSNGSFTNAADHQPPFMDVVWIMRVR